jgi:hypothetical protein
MHAPRNARLWWTLVAGIAGAGLLGIASAAGALSGGTTPPTPANSHANPHASSDRPDPSESDEPNEPRAPGSGPVGPDASGPAAFGLCNAYAHAKKHGKSIGHSIAFRNLAAAAGGAGRIDAYCATVPHPGSSTSPAAGSDETGSLHAHPGGPPSQVPPRARPSGD